MVGLIPLVLAAPEEAESGALLSFLDPPANVWANTFAVFVAPALPAENSGGVAGVCFSLSFVASVLVIGFGANRLPNGLLCTPLVLGSSAGALRFSPNREAKGFCVGCDLSSFAGAGFAEGDSNRLLNGLLWLDFDVS